jgi:hypothetical protein
MASSLPATGTIERAVTKGQQVGGSKKRTAPTTEQGTAPRNKQETIDKQPEPKPSPEKDEEHEEEEEDEYARRDARAAKRAKTLETEGTECLQVAEVGEMDSQHRLYLIPLADISPEEWTMLEALARQGGADGSSRVWKWWRGWYKARDADGWMFDDMDGIRHFHITKQIYIRSYC